MMQARVKTLPWFKMPYSLLFSWALMASMALLLGSACSDGSADSAPPDQTSSNDAGTFSDGRPGKGRSETTGDTSPAVAPGFDASSAGDAKGPRALVTTQAACELKADRHCARLQECSDFFLRLAFGKPEICRARIASACMREVSAVDVGLTPYSLVLCAQELGAQSCSDIIDRREPDSCRPLGLRREGNDCSSHLQCATGFCSLEKKPCGSCKTKRSAGESCDSDAGCLAGLHCGSGGKCVRKGMAGDPCGGENQECGSLLSCLQGKCASPLAAGTACSNTNECVRDLGQLCAPNLPNKSSAESVPVCRAAILAVTGEVCRQGDNLIAYCPGGNANCLKDSEGTYRCAPAAQDGEPCGEVAGKRACMLPATCVAGTCRLGPASSCTM